jgi:hypothetical protein
MKTPVLIRKALYGRISREEFATFFKLTRVELVEGVLSMVINERGNLNGAILESCWLSRLSRRTREQIRAKYFILRSFRALDVISVTLEDLPALVEVLVEDFGEGGSLDFTDSSFLAHGL